MAEQLAEALAIVLHPTTQQLFNRYASKEDWEEWRETTDLNIRYAIRARLLKRHYAELHEATKEI